MQNITANSSLVSVIIPCCNHGRYLARAIQSVLDQQYPSIEIVVIDDGSSDDTKEVAAAFPVKYFYQSNQGLSAARNAGIGHSSGSYLVFLDADDWLLKSAISVNAGFLNHDKSLGFVSGAFLLSRPGLEQEVRTPVNADHYIHFLQGNYVSMHATVMYHRKVFKTIKYDPSLRACEDYDVYLRVSREFPVLHHTQLIAAYWQHDSNMSSDLSMMMKYSIEALNRQKDHLRSPAEEKAFIAGLNHWNSYYSLNMYARLVDTENPLPASLRKKFLQSLRDNNKMYFLKYLFLLPMMPVRKFVKKQS